MKKIYLAGSLFSAAEQEFNLRLFDSLKEQGHIVFLPQEKCKNLKGKEIFEKCKQGIDSSDIVLAILDGADADSGTCWECGYAYAREKHIIAVRTDFRTSGDTGGFNAMLYYSAHKIITTDYLNNIVNYLSNF